MSYKSFFEEYILIRKDTLRNIFLIASREEPTWVPKVLSIVIGAFVAILITAITLTIQHSESVESELPRHITVFWTATVMFLLIILMSCIFKWKEIRRHFKSSNNFDDIIQEIEEKSISKKENTLIIFDVKEEQSKYLFPVKRTPKRNYSYFFPYIEEIEKFKDKDGQINRDKVIDFIKTHYEINVPIDIKYIDELNTTSIALNAERLPVDFHFQYIHVFPKSPFFKSCLHKLLKDKEYEYKSIDEIKKDFSTASNNTIVVESIERGIQEIRKSIRDNYANRQTKIVWNIDKRCNLNCSFCAYGSAPTHNNLALNKKKRVIDAMCKIDIKNIDFAVGANANIHDLRIVLAYANKILPDIAKKITATSEIIKSLGINFLKDNDLGVDITYDYPHLEESTVTHRPCNYNKDNFEIAEQLISEGITVNAHVVIHHNNTDIVHLQDITGLLQRIGVKEILFIRLMPVGKGDIEYPNTLYYKNKYDGALKIVKDSESEGKIKMKLHCALRGLLNEEKNPCQLGCYKLGISSSGDIFTCPWAEHLGLPTSENPFFVGNIQEENFSFTNDANNGLKHPIYCRQRNFSKAMQQ